VLPFLLVLPVPEQRNGVPAPSTLLVGAILGCGSSNPGGLDPALGAPTVVDVQRHARPLNLIEGREGKMACSPTPGAGGPAGQSGTESVGQRFVAELGDSQGFKHTVLCCFFFLLFFLL